MRLVRRLAALGLCEGFHVFRPAPAGLEDQPPDFAAANFEDFRTTTRKLAVLVRLRKGFVHGRFH